MVPTHEFMRNSCFPHPKNADEDGLLAASRDLNAEMLVDAYSHGIFPWPNENLPGILWWSPHERAVFDLDDFHVPGRLRQTLRSRKFRVTSDVDFEAVIRTCASAPRGQRWSGTWITPPLIREYCRLHEMGIAHSVEVWQADRLVGGLYGVALGGFFAGESKFHTVTDASKVALAQTVAHLRKQGFTLFDVQLENPHLKQFGLRLIPQHEYLRRLKFALKKDCDFGKIEV